MKFLVAIVATLAIMHNAAAADNDFRQMTDKALANGTLEKRQCREAGCHLRTVITHWSLRIRFNAIRFSISKALSV